jgi:hypothetical protein
MRDRLSTAMLFPNFFDVFQETHRFCLQSTHAVNNVEHLPRLYVERAFSMP